MCNMQSINEYVAPVLLSFLSIFFSSIFTETTNADWTAQCNKEL